MVSHFYPIGNSTGWGNNRICPIFKQITKDRSHGFCDGEIKEFFFFFFQLGFTPCKAEQPLQGMELQEKETQKDYCIQEI